MAKWQGGIAKANEKKSDTDLNRKRPDIGTGYGLGLEFPESVDVGLGARENGSLLLDEGCERVEANKSRSSVSCHPQNSRKIRKKWSNEWE